jgi:uncharacterized protein YndB with AHSA1/START domain
MGDNTMLRFTYDGVVLENESDRLIQICDMTVKEFFYNFIMNGKTNVGEHMKRNDFTAAITVSKSPQEVFKAITADVAKWWGGKDLEGSSIKLNDEFIIHHPGAHYSKQKLVEVIQDKKIVWFVEEGILHWLKKDKHEWTNTKMIFEIIVEAGKTVLHFTHEGLIPEKESYEKCSQGWGMVIKDWLFKFIEDGVAHF